MMPHSCRLDVSVLLLDEGCITDAKPTMPAPSKTRLMENQWNLRNLRRRTVTDKMPVKITSVPRSIWKTDAYVCNRGGAAGSERLRLHPRRRLRPWRRRAQAPW